VVLCQLIVDIVLYVIVHSKEILINESSSKLSTGISMSLSLQCLSIYCHLFQIAISFLCIMVVFSCSAFVLLPFIFFVWLQ